MCSNKPSIFEVSLWFENPISFSKYGLYNWSWWPMVIVAEKYRQGCMFHWEHLRWKPLFLLPIIGVSNVDFPINPLWMLLLLCARLFRDGQAIGPYGSRPYQQQASGEHLENEQYVYLRLFTNSYGADTWRIPIEFREPCLLEVFSP